MNLSWLPGIDWWGARAIESTVDRDAVAGGLVGVILGSLIQQPVEAAVGLVKAMGYPAAGSILRAVLMLVAAYVALLALAAVAKDDSGE